ncbi:MAG: hypothetical protein HQ462_05070 [Deltaproteobacteria bacterium]|nr:hypothetical protein [Deltaproteobacteria bacterium]
MKTDLKNLITAFKERGSFLFPSLIVIVFSGLISALIWLALGPNSSPAFYPPDKTKTSFLYAATYPANEKFQKELVQLKNRGSLSEKDELEIQSSLLASTDFLDIPPALLWCLLFQESRLNHLEGIDSENSALGLGQFSQFSFFEINHQQSRYRPTNINLIISMFGRDVRPIAAKRKDILSPSSYYSIPTAVVSSAIYLNNRYHQLTQILIKRGIEYHPDLLWLFSAMAYNKGTRSVLTLWNNVQKQNGSERFKLLVNNYEYFRKTTSDSLLLTQSLKRIWDETKARSYSRELAIHTRNISSCALSPLYQTTRTLAEVAP